MHKSGSIWPQRPTWGGAPLAGSTRPAPAPAAAGARPKEKPTREGSCRLASLTRDERRMGSGFNAFVNNAGRELQHDRLSQLHARNDL